ncbi:hypothetical protein [Kineococcus sp. SYSU DK005]|uniref:hypothetical protein n=1 Tax=Kineococcus sp. SYSU DK005 TaxID=3383126 RepID=UPI003D7D7EC4
MRSCTTRSTWTTLGDRALSLYLRARDVLASPRCRRLADSLALPADADVSDLREVVEQRTGREIIVSYVSRHQVRSITGKDDARAAWLRRSDHDLLLVDEAAWHEGRAHNILHELAHMLLDHQCGLNHHLQGVSAATARRILATEPAPAESILARGEWRDPAERDAELLATHLGMRLRPMQVSAPRSPSSALAGVRVRAMLGIEEEQA